MKVLQNQDAGVRARCDLKAIDEVITICFPTYHHHERQDPRSRLLDQRKSGYSSFPCIFWRFARQSAFKSTSRKSVKVKKRAGPLSLAASGFLRLYRHKMHEKDKYPDAGRLLTSKGNQAAVRTCLEVDVGNADHSSRWPMLVPTAGLADDLPVSSRLM
ncbi:hypothetical protein [Paraburkholderia diazotrophica]|uniref:hypothetical protein n=1 Tax=Paraburkholderia diazotrophica TaxID=667676 RepID=UPI003170AE23